MCNSDSDRELHEYVTRDIRPEDGDHEPYDERFDYDEDEWDWSDWEDDEWDDIEDDDDEAWKDEDWS